ncbi:MAG: tetratricopeptide repeat protein [Nocardioidaceae bacterium]
MTKPDATMARIAEGIELRQRGDRDAARRLFWELWTEIGGDHADPFHRCALAHSMADVQDDIREELIWDLRAVDAAQLVTDERAARAGLKSPVASFYPSLHLNLGECYRKLGDRDQARQHLQAGGAAIDALPDDGYGRMIRAGLERLAQRLDDADRAPHSPERASR